MKYVMNEKLSNNVYVYDSNKILFVKNKFDFSEVFKFNLIFVNIFIYE